MNSLPPVAATPAQTTVKRARRMWPAAQLRHCGRGLCSAGACQIMSCARLASRGMEESGRLCSRTRSNCFQDRSPGRSETAPIGATGHLREGDPIHGRASFRLQRLFAILVACRGVLHRKCSCEYCSGRRTNCIIEGRVVVPACGAAFHNHVPDSCVSHLGLSSIV